MPLIFLILTAFIPNSADLGPLFDAYDPIIGIKAENARLDNYAIQLKNSPDSRALIVVYAKTKTRASTATARARRAARYLVKIRGLNPARIAWRYEAACKPHNLILLYLLDPNDADPVRDPKCLRD